MMATPEKVMVIFCAAYAVTASAVIVPVGVVIVMSTVAVLVFGRSV